MDSHQHDLPVLGTAVRALEAVALLTRISAFRASLGDTLRRVDAVTAEALSLSDTAAFSVIPPVSLCKPPAPV